MRVGEAGYLQEVSIYLMCMQTSKPKVLEIFIFKLNRHSHKALLISKDPLISIVYLSSYSNYDD